MAHEPQFENLANNERWQDPAAVKLVLSFIGSGDSRLDTQNYREVKAYCTMNGYLHQCINCDRPGLQGKRKGQGGEWKTDILKSLYRQMLNKSGLLFWGSRLSSLDRALARKRILVIGIDIHHHKPVFSGGEKMQFPSTMGIVGVFMEDDTRNWLTFNDVIGLEAGQELLFSPKDANVEPRGEEQTYKHQRTVEKQNELKAVLERGMSSCNRNPDLVVVYRDGAPAAKLGPEVIAIQEVFGAERVYYLVVEKNNRTRFFSETNDGIFNPPEGLVVDKEITSPFHKDFYLLSTKCNLSTMRPVHYTLKAAPTQPFLALSSLQQLSYTLCYLYPNWVMGSIKLPFVTQCAHKLAGLVGELTEGKPAEGTIHHSLKNSFWYL